MSEGTLPSASSRNAVGVLITRAAMPDCSIDDMSEPGSLRLRLTPSQYDRRAGGALAKVASGKFGPT